MCNTVSWNGKKLPPLRRGNVWGMQIYPGGRKVIQQTRQESIMNISKAVDTLLSMGFAVVRLDDAAETVRRWNEEKGILEE